MISRMIGHVTRRPERERLHARINELNTECARLTAERDALEVFRQLAALQGIHTGERCVIIGMGPSLEVSDLDRLTSVATFACNKIYLAFENTAWRPTYYTVSDVLVAEHNREQIAAMQAVKLFPDWVRNRLQGFDDVQWIPVAEQREEYEGAGVGFSRNLCEGIQPGGCTVLYDQIQIAWHMGFQEVILIGVDFFFDVDRKTGETCEHGDVLVGRGKQNHFHPDYRKPGETWTMPKMEEQHRAFTVARRVFEQSGRRLLNASRRTALDALERADFDELFAVEASSPG